MNKNLYHLTLQISIKDVMLADIFCSVHGNWNVQIKVRLAIIFLVLSIFISQLNVCRRCYYFFIFYIFCCYFFWFHFSIFLAFELFYSFAMTTFDRLIFFSERRKWRDLGLKRQRARVFHILYVYSRYLLKEPVVEHGSHRFIVSS